MGGNFYSNWWIIIFVKRFAYVIPVISNSTNSVHQLKKKKREPTRIFSQHQYLKPLTQLNFKNSKAKKVSSQSTCISNKHNRITLNETNKSWLDIYKEDKLIWLISTTAWNTFINDFFSVEFTIWCVKKHRQMSQFNCH